MSLSVLSVAAITGSGADDQGAGLQVSIDVIAHKGFISMPDEQIIFQ